MNAAPLSAPSPIALPQPLSSFPLWLSAPLPLCVEEFSLCVSSEISEDPLSVALLLSASDEFSLSVAVSPTVSLVSPLPVSVSEWTWVWVDSGSW